MTHSTVIFNVYKNWSSQKQRRNTTQYTLHTYDNSLYMHSREDHTVVDASRGGKLTCHTTSNTLIVTIESTRADHDLLLLFVFYIILFSIKRLGGILKSMYKHL